MKLAKLKRRWGRVAQSRRETCEQARVSDAVGLQSAVYMLGKPEKVPEGVVSGQFVEVQ